MSKDWSDLRARALSGVAMVALGAVCIAQGGLALQGLAIAVSGLMIWELARLCGLGGRIAQVLGAMAAVAQGFVVLSHAPITLLFVFVPALLGAPIARGSRRIFAAYSVAIMLTGYGLVALREGFGAQWVVWVVGVVVISDIAGYFAGRTFGGPKFWPAISPKKTWSGTVAGWLGAAVWGIAFTLYQGGATPANMAQFAALSAGLSLAGQLGDIAESALKRRAGIKDSSNLIPGHGGVLDRFDALVGAMLALILVGQGMLLIFALTHRA